MSAGKAGQQQAGDTAEVEFDPFAGPAIQEAFASTEPQREIWTATRIGEDASLAFNESISLRLSGLLDRNALTAAIRALVERHEALRSSFSDDGTTVLVHEAPDIDLAIHEFGALADEEAEKRLAEILNRAVTEPFDLASPTLARFELVTLGTERNILVMTAHHIVCDGWSFGVIASDLAALYSAFRQGRTPELAPADRFSEYARALYTDDSPELAAAEKYWLKQFDSAIPILDLPSDRARPARKTYSADREDYVLSPELLRRLRETGKKKGASLFATLLAGFGTLLHRLSGQSDLIVGIPVAGQASTGFPNLVGHCVNMLPLRLHPAPEMKFSAMLAQARTTMLDALDNQQMTLGSLLRRLPIPRDPSRLPLVSVILNVDRRLDSASMPFEGLRAELRGNPRLYETFDIFINAVEQDDGLVLETQYNTDLYDRATIRRWLATYERVLAAVADNPDANLDEISLLSPADLDAIALCNGPQIPVLHSNETIHGLIEAQAKRTPDSVAIECEGASITYGELDARTNQLARYLRSLGVGPNVIVGLCVSRSIEMLAGMVSILKAGGAYLPLDPDYPRSRLAFMAEDSGMLVLLTEEKVRSVVDLDGVRIVSVDGDAIAISRESAAPLDLASDSEDTAYVIYTSGSTGRPKGVVVPHRSVVNLLRSVAHTPGLSGTDVVLAITTPSFDIAVSELILPLTVGARIVLATRDVATDGIRLAQLIAERGVTFIDATPATYRLLLAAGWKGASHLRLICTGEAMPLDLALKLPSYAAEVWNGYGPTETTVWATFFRILPGLQSVLIGKPVANTVAYVLDANMRQVPVGVRGELFIGGTAVTKGYLNRPELTAERFLRDPFSTNPDARLYKTGDVVRLLPDGNLECLGRTDNQVKVRGFRIELGEIENVLLQHPAVGESAVVVREDKPGDVRMVAFLVKSGTNETTDKDLKAFAKESLPDHMVPHGFVWIPVMPLTPSGKIDRKALAAFVLPDREQAEFVPPRTETERMLAAVWSETLGIGRVSIRDDFFALGGHSLLASQILSRLRRDCQVEISFRKVFEAPTIEMLAQLIDEAKVNGAAKPAFSAIPHVANARSAAVSILQERLWMLEELDPAQALTHMHGAAWRLSGAHDPKVVEAVLLDFINRHETLRTSFRVIDGVRTQIIEPDTRFALNIVDMSGVPEEQRHDALAEHFRTRQLVPFDLESAPLFRADLIVYGPEESILYSVRHGIIWDGWSFDIFISEFAELYAARVEGRAPALKELPISYGDFARWQRQWMNSPAAASQAAWWRAQLRDLPPALDLPTDRPRPDTSPLEGGRVSIVFSAEEIEQLKNLARKYDSTLFMLFFAAYNVLLHRYTGETDLVVGSPVRARTRAETENVVGPFVNTVALRTRLSPEMPFADVLRQVREVSLESFSYQELPFELLGATPPTLRVLFSMQDARERPVQAGNLELTQVHVPESTASNDMMLWTMEKHENLIAVLNYSTSLFDVATADRLLSQLRTLLLSALEDPEKPVATIKILPDDELLAVLPPPASARASNLSHVEEAFENVCARSPESVALVAGGETLTYRQLRDRVYAGVNALRAASILPGNRVAVCSGASAVVGTLATMLAECAVVLVDPEDPSAYTATLFSDTQVAALIGNEDERQSLPSDVLPPVVIDPSTARTHNTANSAESDLPGSAVVAITHLAGPDGHPVETPFTRSQFGALIDSTRATLRLGANDVVVAPLQSGLDVALIELLLPLTCGARLVLAPEGEVAGADELADLMTRVGATAMIAPTSVWLSLADVDWQGGPQFRAVVSDGLPTADYSDLAQRAGAVFRSYGYPDGAIWSALTEAHVGEPVPLIAKPFAHSDFVVLSDVLEPVPIGVTGGLYLTRRFNEDSHASHNGHPRLVRSPLVENSALFRTGDRARRMKDHSVRGLGTDPTRSRVGGYVVEYAAVEKALLSHPAVDRAAVTAFTDERGINRLVAYVITKPGEFYTDTELRSEVRKRLPRAMVPQRFVEIDSLPVDQHGEVDRSRLESPFASEMRREYTPPRTKAEHILGDLWKKALELDRVDVQDNFFMLGGSSLLCFRVIDGLQRENGIRLSPRVMLLGTLEQAAAQIESLLGQSPDSGTNSGSPSLPGSTTLESVKG